MVSRFLKSIILNAIIVSIAVASQGKVSKKRKQYSEEAVSATSLFFGTSGIPDSSRRTVT